MSRKLHIYCSNERKVSTIDAPLSDVSWSLIVMVVLLGSLLLSSECILIPIKWTRFTKNNYLMLGIRFVNALHVVIIFIGMLFCLCSGLPLHH